MKDTYFIEIVCNSTGKKWQGTEYLRGIVVAESEEQAKEKTLAYYKPYYDSLHPVENGEFYVQCCWIINSPTLKVVKEVKEELFKGAKMTQSVRANNYEGTVIGHREFQAFDNVKKVIEDWERCDITWGDIYYDNKISAYVVEIHPYMCLPCVVKTFKGGTKEIYDEACKWVKDNTIKRDHFSMSVKQKLKNPA